MISDVLAASEVLGRHVVERIPDLRARVGRWARRPSVEEQPLTLGALCAALDAIGLQRNRDLLVHSSWAGLRQLRAKPSEVVATLRSYTGDAATLVMPAHPIEKEEGGLLLFDVERTPSRMGMLSETFRRTPGVVRSPVPVAPVSALGRAAAEYTSDYRGDSSSTPWGIGSPWWQICERDGQVLVLGVDFVRTLTLMHVAFDVLGAENPIDDYYEDVHYLVTQRGVAERWTMRRQRRDLETYLATLAFRRLALEAGVVRSTTVSGIQVAILDAKRFLAWHLPIARTTGLPYWGYSLRKSRT
jgi:aminoglycoside 3-N-acetyltransferase